MLSKAEEILLKEIEEKIILKTVEWNDYKAKAEQAEEVLKTLHLRKSNLTGNVQKWDTFELDISETVKTVELGRHLDRGDW